MQKSKEVQKREFIQSLKRLITFFNNIPKYEPNDKIVEKAQDFQTKDFSQQYKIFQYKTENQEQQFANQKMDQTVLEYLMDDKNHIEDEEFIQKAMQVSPEEMQNNFKPDQQWFEEASNAIRQARKFQYLIHRQENVFFKRNINKNQQIINEKQHEVNDLKEQLKGIQQKIQISKKNETDIKNNIRETNAKASREMAIMTRRGIELQKLTDQSKEEYTKKFEELDQKLDAVRYVKHLQAQQFQEIYQNNNMMYFFPIKVQEQNEKIQRKKVELELYRKIITETLGFMKQRIQENKHKQLLVNKVNSQVGEEIDQLLQEEAEYYESTDRDQLKTPPFVNVKRIERPGTVNAIPKQTQIKQVKISSGYAQQRRKSKEKKIVTPASGDIEAADIRIEGVFGQQR